jgi:hypothetical protein
MRCGFLALAMALLANPSLSSRIEAVKSAIHLQAEPTGDDEEMAAKKYAMKCGATEPEPGDGAVLLQEVETEAVVQSSFLEDHEVSDILLNLSASEASGRANYIDYDCTAQEFYKFSADFNIAGNPIRQPNCGITKHRNFENQPICTGQKGPGPIVPEALGNVLFMYPWEDHNNAFCINNNVCHRMSEWDFHACSVRMRRIQSVEDASDQLDHYPDTSLKHVVLGGHGSGSALHWGDVNQCGRGVLCVGEYLSNAFLEKLSKKMYQHGTIFLDSCLSATNDESRFRNGKNLASWVASKVGKGIRVIGSVLSFGKVRVTRFRAWYAQIDVARANGVQRTTVASGASCPAYAMSSSPDSAGDCQCPDLYPECKTTDGGLCPRSKGQSSVRHFLPMCAEDWASVKCGCYSSSGILATPPPTAAATARSCADWDVRFASRYVTASWTVGYGTIMQKVSGTPEVFNSGRFKPICGHWFWNDNTGASHFCKKLGYVNGTTLKVMQTYESDAVEIRRWGTFETGAPWFCSAGNEVSINIACIGPEIAGNEMPSSSCTL